MRPIFHLITRTVACRFNSGLSHDPLPGQFIRTSGGWRYTLTNDNLKKYKKWSISRDRPIVKIIVDVYRVCHVLQFFEDF